MTEPSTVEVRDQGTLARAVGMIVSPGETLRAVIARPRPGIILLLVCIVISLATALPQMTERGRQTTLNMQVQQTERVTGKPVTPEAYASMQKFVGYSAYISAVAVFIMVPVITLLFSAVYWALFNTVLGGSAAFKEVVGIVAHTQVIGALGAVLGAPIQYFKGVQTAAGPFNLGALAPWLDPSTFLAKYLSGMNVFTIWALIATSIGLAILYRRRTTMIATTLIVIYLLLAGAFTAGMSSFMGR
ncbi:MAG TPA: YIP1 family protein [Vicinamibacterales bacterium]|nr:YIP1 family protein [Vicinamibacterales bacterium]